MNPYAETRAAVVWPLDKERGDRAWDQLTAAAAVHTFDLTLTECDRTRRRVCRRSSTPLGD